MNFYELQKVYWPCSIERTFLASLKVDLHKTSWYSKEHMIRLDAVRDAHSSHASKAFFFLTENRTRFQGLLESYLKESGLADFKMLLMNVDCLENYSSIGSA